MDLFGRPLIAREEWEQREKSTGGAKDIATMKSYAGVFSVEKAEGESETDAQIRILITSAARDRDRDSINAAGWELGNYLKNPVVLWAHMYRELPVARDTGLTVAASGLVGTPVFTSQDENPFGHMCGKLIRGKFLNAASIGMLPLEWTYDEEARGYNFTRQELLEYSIVPVPANADALVVARSKGIDISPLKSWAEQLLDQWHGEPVIALPRKTAERAWQIVTRNPSTIVMPKGVTATLTGENADDVKAAREQIEAALQPPNDPAPNAVPEKATAPEQSEPTEPPRDRVVLTLAPEPKERTFAVDRPQLRSLICESVGEMIAAHTGRLD